MRISIIGQSSSGKSTLAQKISEKLNIPHIHLDRFWFEAGGHKLIKPGETTEESIKVRAYIKEKVEEVTQQDSWVSDGWYSREQPFIALRADQILFLDIPLYRRLWNHVHRVFVTERHPELSKWDEFKFLYEIIRRTPNRSTKMREIIEKNKGKSKILRNYKEIDEYLKQI
jgi:adenylate kinase family enzyme